MYQSVAGIFLGGEKYALVLGRASLSNAHFCYYMAEKLQGGGEGGWGARAYCATSWLCPCYLHTHTQKKKHPIKYQNLRKKKKGRERTGFRSLVCYTPLCTDSPENFGKAEIRYKFDVSRMLIWCRVCSKSENSVSELIHTFIHLSHSYQEAMKMVLREIP